MKTQTNIQITVSSQVRRCLIFIFLISLFSTSSFGQLDNVASDDKKHPSSANSIFTDSNAPHSLFLSFDVETSERHALIKWSMFLEVDCILFAIERSLDLSEWEVIHQIESGQNLMVQGESSWIDNEPYTGMSYYRLKIVDIDGGIEYSPIKSFNFNYMVETSELLAYPNPAISNLTIEGSTNELENFTILSASGLDLSSTAHIIVKNSNSLIIDVSTLPTGFYYIKTPTNFIKVSKL
ncbi:MAG: hypothetical protein COA38_18865 [Fluviicola sp.]|nr:MAG: hypothetical protein COA38_18865 [Fluviicola sp.]